MTHQAEATGFTARLRRSFASESFPPKWLLVIGMLAVILGLSWANYRITAAENTLTAQAVEAAEFAKNVDQVCVNKRPVFKDSAAVCDAAADKADDPLPVPVLDAPVPGRDGRPGQDGQDGGPGKDGLPGKDGVPGTAGKDGVGLPGIDGFTPESPPPGTNGANGTNGTNGTDGAVGATGPAPTKLTFSDGTTCTPTAPGSTEYTCDGPPPKQPSPGPTNPPLLP